MGRQLGALAPIILLTLVIAGCQREQPKASLQTRPQGQETPQATLRKFHRAMTENDVVAAIECYTGPKGYEGMVKAGLVYTRSVWAFHDALEKVYGPSAVTQYKEAKTDPAGDFDVVPRSVESLDLERISVDGDTVVAWDPDRKEETTLVRRDGVWRIDAGQADVRVQTRILEASADIAAQAIHEMGRNGQTIPQLKQSLGKRILRVVLQTK